MSLFNTVRNTIVPVHKEGYPFIAAFFVASLVLGWIFKPLFWIGLILTLWCAYFFRDPERMTPQDDDLVISRLMARFHPSRWSYRRSSWISAASRCCASRCS